jgi:hypothetical protein
MRKLAAEVREGNRRRVLFLVPPNSTCSGPLYEMVVMLDTWLRRKRVRGGTDVTWATCEERYVEAFTPQLHDMVDEAFRLRGIKGHTGYVAQQVTPGEVLFANGDRLPHDLLVTFPPYVAAARFDSLPTNERGFIYTDVRSGRVPGHPDIFAVGDTVDLPVKQALIAFLQADAAADHLSAEILGVEPGIFFDPAAVASMDLGAAEGAGAGAPERPPPAGDPAGWTGPHEASSPVSRLGKMALGIYLPWRFKASNPFHAGLPWKGMDAGLRVMSGLLAR